MIDAAADPRHVFGDYDCFFEVDATPDYEPPPEASIAAIAEKQGHHPVEILCDLLLADEGRGLVYYPIFNYDAGDLEAPHRGPLPSPVPI